MASRVCRRCGLLYQSAEQVAGFDQATVTLGSRCNLAALPKALAYAAALVQPVSGLRGASPMGLPVVYSVRNFGISILPGLAFSNVWYVCDCNTVRIADWIAAY